MKSKISPKQRPKLERGLIVDAAINRIERHGLEELSARKLAQDLGCEAMSLYHHVGNMEALKDSVVDELLGTISPAASKQHVDAIGEEARSYLSLANTYPRSFQLIATRRWKGSHAAEAAARAVARFGAIGFEPQEALARSRALGAYLNGAGLALAAWTTDAEARSEDAEAVESDLRRGLQLLVRTLVTCG